MLKRKGRPKEPKAVKLNPPNVILPASETTTGSTAGVVTEVQIKYKCDNPKCPTEATVHINARYCKLCAQDKGFCLND